MIYDVFTYNGERLQLDLRLNILNEHVDRFIICEAKTTFSGYKKPLYFSEHERYFKKFWPKITYHIIKEEYSEEEIALADSSPNTVGASHWKREFLQKESIKKSLKHANNDDIVYISDVDEIWDASYSPYLPVERMKLRVYAYYLDNRSDEVFWGILRAKWGDIKDTCLNHVRTDMSILGKEYGGWHFTSMGGVKEVSRKLNDSYTTDSYNTAQVQSELPQRIEQGVDYLGRTFNFRLDESEWPQYLKDNRELYEKFCKVNPETLLHLHTEHPQLSPSVLAR